MSTPDVPQEAVEAAMAAMGCDFYADRSGNYCATHRSGWLSDVNACVRAESIAAAVVAALALDVRDREVGARALEDAAEYVTPKHWTGPKGTLLHLNHWLHARASEMREGRADG